MDSFWQDGFGTLRAVFTETEVRQFIAESPNLGSAAGSRNLLLLPFFKELSSDPRLTSLARSLLGADGLCVRGILFDKSPEANWVLGFHQDTKIAVRTRAEAPGYERWSVKEGVVHCLPPERILSNMVALRIALDAADERNGALLCLPGTHRLGLLNDASVAAHSVGPPTVCRCEPGDVVAMHPLTLHASSKSETPRRRRVIHFEYCAEKLDPPLEWAFA